MDLKTFSCQLCEERGQWEHVDRFTNQSNGMFMCTNCGFITYPHICNNITAVNDFYKNEYRSVPKYSNLKQAEVKLQYHKHILGSEINGDGAVYESGFGLGLLLNYIKVLNPKSRVYGTELTTGFVNVAANFYNVEVASDIDKSEKHRLIVSYQVAEHIPKIREELDKYYNCLDDSGFLYICVPVWFDAVMQFDGGKLNIDYYYNTNHLNVWSQNLFENLLSQFGFEITKFNNGMYWNAYLCKKNPAIRGKKNSFDNIQKKLDELGRIKKAIKANDDLEFNNAIELWPNFPEAHFNLLLKTVKENPGIKSSEIVERIISPALKSCHDSIWFLERIVSTFLANKCFNEAKVYLERLKKICPISGQAISMEGSFYKQRYLELGDKNDARLAIDYFRRMYFTFDSVKKNSIDEIYNLCAEVDYEPIRY